MTIKNNQILDNHNQSYPHICPSHYCKDSQITTLKLSSITTHFVNVKHNFPKEIETFSKNKLIWFREKCFKILAYCSELPFHHRVSL